MHVTLSADVVALTMNPEAIARRGKHLEHFTIALMVVPVIANEGGKGNERQDVLRLAWMNLKVGN